jgi:hypothetical protein
MKTLYVQVVVSIQGLIITFSGKSCTAFLGQMYGRKSCLHSIPEAASGI